MIYEKNQSSKISCYSPFKKGTGTGKFLDPRKAGQKGDKGKKTGSGSKDPVNRPDAGSSQAGSKFSLKVTGKRFISKEMLPSSCYKLAGSKVKYFHNGVEMEFPREYTVNQVKKDISFPTRPVHVVDNLGCPSLMVPGTELPSAVRSNPRLLLLPQIKAITYHAYDGEECRCIAHNTQDRYHREAVLPDTCLKGNLISYDSVMVSPPELQLQENPSHFYVRSESEDDSFLAVPTPFPVGGSWPTLRYEPVMAGRWRGPQVAQYYALYNSNRFREVAKIYQKCPKDWNSVGGSPVICEASTSNEVGLVSERLYGLETIPRVGFPAHPASEPVILLYPAMVRETRRVPVFKQDSRHPSLQDAAIGDVFRPL